MTVPIYSMIENGLVEPNKEIRKELNRLFPVKASSSPYKNSELFGIKPSYKLTVRIPLRLMETFREKVGGNLTAWVIYQMEKAISE